MRRPDTLQLCAGLRHWPPVNARGACSARAAILAPLESFRGRCRPSGKIVLALLQPPRAEPSNADERLQSLRKAGDLDSKALFVLQTQRSNGDSRVEEADARRLDHALLECASQYYKDESRRNKKAKQAAAQRATAPQLLARAHFKRAYYSEFRRGGTIPTRPTPPLQGCRRAPVALTPPDSVHARRP